MGCCAFPVHHQQEHFNAQPLTLATIKVRRPLTHRKVFEPQFRSPLRLKLRTPLPIYPIILLHIKTSSFGFSLPHLVAHKTVCPNIARPSPYGKHGRPTRQEGSQRMLPQNLKGSRDARNRKQKQINRIGATPVIQFCYQRLHLALGPTDTLATGSSTHA
jgi:hypothetical protein